MPKVFRNTRLHSLADGKLMNYFKYAIGEIILVVIGILIALSINNWNQGRINHNTEIKYLKNIQKELLSHTSLNQSLVSNRMAKKVDGLKLAKQFCEHQSAVSDTLDFLNAVSFGGVFSGGYLFGNRNLYDDLISTGNLQLIKNDSLKNAITSYYAYMENIKERATVHSSRFSSFMSELRPFDATNPEFISTYDQAEMMQAFQTPEFRKLVDLELSYAYKIRDYIDGQRSRSERVLKLIDQELNN